ncbi:MAG: hypothetical protein WBN04_07900 [Paracoccaceae bacterium]
MALAKVGPDVDLPQQPKNGYAMQPTLVYQDERPPLPLMHAASRGAVKMILDQLKALREEFAECQVVALADLSSGIVLCVSAKDKQPQERLDALCATAAELLDGKTAVSFANALELPQVSAVRQSVVTTQSETIIFLRSPADTPEALICVCSPTIDVAAMLEAAKTKFDRIAASQ